jgi:predicted acyltransferase
MSMENIKLTTNEKPAEQSPSPKKERLQSLDVFRGLTLLGMVLVNSHGDSHFRYFPLNHVPWHGWSYTDLVFPFFLFIVGAAIPYSVENRRARGAGQTEIILHTLRRALVLFAIGLAMNWWHKFDFAHPALDLAHLRLFGILQRIALCSIAATAMYLWCKPKTQVIFAATVLVFYFVVMKFVPVPGYGAGVLEQVGNWAQYIDSHVMGAHCGSISRGGVFEGKGLLSTLPAIVTTLLGLWTGRYLRTPAGPQEKLVNLYFFGSLGMFLGAFWDNFFPINQNLWTSSLVLLMGGMAAVVLASCHYIADVRKITWWTPPGQIFGMNSIAVWIGSTTFRDALEKIKFLGSDGKLVNVKTYMFNGLAEWFGPWNGSLAFAILYVLFWLVIMDVFYRRKIFFKI